MRMAHHRRPLSRRPGRPGFTLLELMLGIVVTSLVMTMLAGLTHAVHTAWEYADRLHESYAESSAILDRIEYMIGHCGTYQLTGENATVGVAVLATSYGSSQIPHRLVLWSGGRDGGMAAQGVQTRLPTADELLVYTVSPQDPTQLREVAFPGSTVSVDFQSADFATTIDSLLAGSAAEPVALTENLAAVTVSGLTDPVPTLRFDTYAVPSATDLATATPGTSSWDQLPWIHGLNDDDGGLRQHNITIELQIARDPERAPAEPAFGSGIVRYWY